MCYRFWAVLVPKLFKLCFRHRLLERILAKADSLGLSVDTFSVEVSAVFDSLIQSAVF